MIKVLIIDDEHDVFEMLKDMIELDYDNSVILHALDGPTALEHMNNDTFDLIISDYMLPKMDGISLIKNKSETKANLTPVIFMSGNIPEDIMEQFNEIESEIKVLHKPFSPEVFLDHIENFANKAS